MEKTIEELKTEIALYKKANKEKAEIKLVEALQYVTHDLTDAELREKLYKLIFDSLYLMRDSV